MRLETTRFGVLDVEDDAILTFTQPIIGFQEFRRFIVIPGPDKTSVSWLQSTESGELAFILMDPRNVVPDYTVQLSPNEMTELAATEVSELDIYTIVVVPNDRTKIRTNLKAPILINTKHRLGKQTILERGNYPVQFYLSQAKPSDEESQEVSDARANS